MSIEDTIILSLFEQRKMIVEKLINVGGNYANMAQETEFLQPQLNKVDRHIRKYFELIKK